MSIQKKAHEYNEYFGRFEKRMHETIKAWEDAEDPCDNPVSDFLGIKDQLVEKEMEIEKDNLRRLMMKLRKQLTHNFAVCDELLKASQGKKRPVFQDLLVVDVFPLETIYARLIGYDWYHLKWVALEGLEDCIIYCRRSFDQIEETLSSLHGNMQQPPLWGYLISLLKAVSKDRKKVEVYLDKAIDSIDTIKLIKKGTAKK